MKRIVLLLLLLQIGWIAYGTPTEGEGVFKITGHVHDEEGHPLAGAVVAIENSMLGTSTTADGSYSLTLRRAGDYQIFASFMGYGKVSKEVFIDSDTKIDFNLVPESIMSEAVIVSATRASNRMPIAQTNINAEEIERQKSGFDVPYLLEMVPSVVAVSEGGTGVGNTSFRIRGTDATRINVTVNGIPLNDPESQGVYWVNMPDFANSVENIQVQRGVGTSTHGAGAFGASVNFQTTTLTPEPFAYAEAMAGSFNTFRTSVKAGTGLINDMFSFETRYSKVKSDGFIDRGWSDHESLFVTGAWHSEKSLLRYNLIHGVQHTGITWEGTPSYMLEENRRYNPAGYMGTDELGNELFYPNESDNYTQTHHHLLFSHQLSNSLSLNVAGYWIIGEGYYEQFKRNKKLADYGFTPFELNGETIEKFNLVRQKWLDNDLFGATYSLSYTKSKLNAILGGGWNRYNNNHFGNLLWADPNINISKNHEWYRNQGEKSDLNIFLKATYEVFENLSLFGDIQYRGIDYKLSGSDDDLQSLEQKHDWKFFNPKGGVFYQLSANQEAFFSVAMAHREPSRADIKDAMKYGTNNTPRNEKLIDYELGYNLKSQSIAFGVNLFYMDYKDQLVLTGKLSEVGYPLMTNVEKSYRRGIELTLGIMPLKWFRWDANVSLSQNKIENFVSYVDLYDASWEYVGQNRYELGTTDISFSPPVVAASQIRIEPIKNLGLSFISKYVGSQYIDNTSSKERMLEAYLVNNLKLDYSLKVKGIKNINLQLLVNNIFNNDYIANGWVWRAEFNDGSPEYREDGFFPQAGINFMGRIALEF
jgi:iron complex outermembrane receptor protein